MICPIEMPMRSPWDIARTKALIAGVFRVHEAAMNLAAEGLSTTERATLIRLLKKLGLSADERFAAGAQEGTRS